LLELFLTEEQVGHAGKDLHFQKGVSVAARGKVGLVATAGLFHLRILKEFVSVGVVALALVSEFLLNDLFPGLVLLR
jgi:hypothetical protein